MKLNTLVLSICSTVIVLGACSRGIDESESVVRKYNAALIRAFASGDTAPLNSIAGEREVRKVGTLMDFKRNAGLVLESELLNLTVNSYTGTADNASTVTTTERWRYFDRSLKPGIPQGKTIKAEMKLKYFLKKESGVWKVEKVEGISTKNVGTD
jgi:hypothetical protein